MKLLTEYLSSKVKLNDKFPMELDKDKIIEFLKGRGFIEAHTDSYTWENAFGLARLIRKPMYILGQYDETSRYSHFIMFCNGGECSHENPMYMCRTHPDALTGQLDDCFISDANTRDGKAFKVFKTYEEFAEDVKRTNGWS